MEKIQGLRGSDGMAASKALRPHIQEGRQKIQREGWENSRKKKGKGKILRHDQHDSLKREIKC